MTNVSEAPAKGSEAMLTDFLLARIAEDDAAARSATGSKWAYYPERLRSDSPEVNHGIIADFASTPNGAPLATPVRQAATESDARHFARHDPARALAECAAYREIVEDNRYCTWGCGEEPNCHDCITLGRLATIYSDHEDYRDEWRP